MKAIGTMGFSESVMSRRRFIGGAAAFGTAAFGAAGCASSRAAADADGSEDAISVWQRETDLVRPEDYRRYLDDGKTRGFATLEKLEAAFEKVVREAKAAKVGGVPAVWSVYNMGYVVKTRESLFSVDLVHRRAAELAPMLDFALITHNHADHWRPEFYKAMNGAGKTVVSNFLDNYGAADWRKSGDDWYASGGYTRAAKEFRIKDVAIRTSLIDHNAYLVDFVTAFEIKVGDFVIYHTGDSGKGTEPKLRTTWGRPDLWLFFPGCGIDTAKAIAKVNAKKVAFGHAWELGHGAGRLNEELIRPRLAEARNAGCDDVSLAFWGDRIV